MLNQQQGGEEKESDPFVGIFQEGTAEFVTYIRQKGDTHKTRHQKHIEKMEKREKDMQDEVLKKNRNRERRQFQKRKINKIISVMTHEEVKVFMADRAKKRRLDKEKVRNAMGDGQVIMVDLAYQSKMNSKENKSLGKQIELITQTIKHIDNPPSIHICSLGGQTKAQLQKMGYNYWLITEHDQGVLQTGIKLNKKLVYLSPDAQQPLQHVDPDCGYILGGLIDRTIIKYASLFRARELGIEARRLPIRQFMKSRIVLNLDHVVMMLCKFRQVGDWKTAFDFGAPKRWKKEEEKGENEENQEENSEEGSERSQSKEKEQILKQKQEKVEEESSSS